MVFIDFKGIKYTRVYVFELPETLKLLVFNNQKASGKEENSNCRLDECNEDQGGFNWTNSIDGPGFWSDLYSDVFDIMSYLKNKE